MSTVNKPKEKRSLEERVDLIEDALKVLQKWVDAQTDISESDTILFNQIDERLKKLEAKHI